MAKTKVYFWLKIDKKFFDNIFIKKLKTTPNGYAMTVIYMRLLLESLDSDCILYYEGYFDNLKDELALKLDVSEEDMEMTIEYFTKCGLIQIDEDKNAELTQAKAMVMSETNWASYKRGQRQNKDSLDNVQKSLTNSNSCPTEIESEIESKIESKKEIEIELESKIESKKEIEIELEAESKSKKEKNYIFDFDEASPSFVKMALSNTGYSVDVMSDEFLIDATDEEFIAGLTYYSFNREPDTYEINTIKKRLNKFDRLLVKEIYKRAGLHGADSVAYVTTSLQNLEKENVYTIEDWEKFQNLSVEEETEDLI
ncbi:phage replisome organizer N-terminal domain-containing protein [Streptococcus suis]|uniref:phage replisome organizer N-terminal domain-containing protein n=1 Tax=Streptococcus TaxID=1301 RepID=UPI002AA400C5|nr:phage replisome organizer N-terminal domain-containing protein [Streptococcus suis]HEM6489323.1 phage replisome organizer N-terminal domain-containing protein [Streptococcus suis]